MLKKPENVDLFLMVISFLPIFIPIIKLFHQSSLIKKTDSALAGVAQWTEHWPVNQKVAG